ncbi:hypothetical protein GGF39_001062 [Coemansia sp. RSA 1721]|nr:hypothetical protein GGF39_001062 [Coemansia sp. RSA 1721]
MLKEAAGYRCCLPQVGQLPRPEHGVHGGQALEAHPESRRGAQGIVPDQDGQSSDSEKLKSPIAVFRKIPDIPQTPGTGASYWRDHASTSWRWQARASGWANSRHMDNAEAKTRREGRVYEQQQQ